MHIEWIITKVSKTTTNRLAREINCTAGQRLRGRFSATATRFLLRCGNVSFRLSNSPSTTTTVIIARWLMRWATGCGCAFFIAPPSPSTRVRGASLDLATLAPSSSWSVWAHLHIAFSCQRVPASMMSFMWVCWSLTVGSRRQRHQRYRQSPMVGQHYPDYQLEDELFAQAGRDVMTGIGYVRRGPNQGPN